MAEHPHVELVRRTLRAMSEGDGAALVENVTADFVLNIPGDHLLSGEHKGRDADRQIFEQVRQETDNTYRPEPQRLFIDGRGHLICEWRTVADRRGRHLDALSAALFTIAGGRIASAEQHEEDIDALNEFWSATGEQASAAGSADRRRESSAARRPEVELVRRTLQGMSQGDSAILSETATSDLMLHVPGNHRFSGEHKGLDALRQLLDRLRAETDGTARWETQHVYVDGSGHAIGTRRMTADRRGRHLDALGAAHCTIVGGRLTDVLLCEENLDAVNQFWS
jgi:uncharacterized protein